MSREAFETIVHDYESWDAAGALEDKICLYAVSKVIKGEARVEHSEVQSCTDMRCKTLKRHSIFKMELESGPCDSETSRAALSGVAEGDIVGAFIDGDTTKRGGHTGAFKWGGGASDLVGRLRGVGNAGTHHPPFMDCEKCRAEGHAEGWLRAAVVGGEHEGCRVAASYVMKFTAKEDSIDFDGILEGLLICQC